MIKTSHPQENAPVRHVLSTGEAAPAKVSRVGVCKHYEEVAYYQVRLITRNRENGSKVRVKEVEELSQRSTHSIVHVVISSSFRWSL